ncbi:MAG: hypothetical protein V7L27_26670 [Nostoc sp.]|uniref:hypothetical protein n=1 Tax=Nostoc sp. TaxID=1180 RepID=UPI002FF719B5
MMFRLLKLVGLLSLSTSFFSVGIIAPALSQSQKTPTQETTDNSRTESKEYPTQIATDNEGSTSITWELKSCAKKKDHIVSCIFSFSSSENLDYNVYSQNETRLVDKEGNEYHVSKIATPKKVVGYNSSLSFNVYKDVQYKVAIDFTDVPDSALYAIALYIKTGSRSLNQRWPEFQNVPFINLDGSISEVPISARHNKKPNDQDSNENQNTNPIINIPKICLPLIGCH